MQYGYYCLLTDKESTFLLYNVMKFSRSFLLKSMHPDWYICQSRHATLHGSTNIQLDFYNGDPDVLERCAFSFEPIPQYDNKYKNCKNVVGPVKHQAISGQPLPHPAHLLPETPPLPRYWPSCIPVCKPRNLEGMEKERAKVPRIPAKTSVASPESN